MNAHHENLSISGNRRQSTYYNVCDIVFAYDGSELWVTDIESHINIIDTQDWYVKDQICIENRFASKLLQLPDRLAQVLYKQAIANNWIGITNKNELMLLYHNNNLNRICYELTVLNASTMLRDICISSDGQTLIAGFKNGKLHLYSMAFLLRHLLREQFNGLNTTNDHIGHYQSAIDKRVSFHRKNDTCKWKKSLLGTYNC